MCCVCNCWCTCVMPCVWRSETNFQEPALSSCLLEAGALVSACSLLAALPSSGQVFCLCLPACLWNAVTAHACYPTQVCWFACLLASFVGSGLQTWVLSLCSRQQTFLPTESSSWPSDCFCDDFISSSFNFCLDKEERHLPGVRSTASRCFSFTHRPRLWLLAVGCLTSLQWKMTRFVLQSSKLINGI